MDSDSMKGRYSIQLASKISGVGVHTIRAWEKRYQAVVPDRSSSGRREYSDSDIEKLALLNELCTLGHSIGKIATLESSELTGLLKKLGKQVDNVKEREASLRSASTVVDVAGSLKGLILALESYKLDVINHEINKLKLILNGRQLALEIITPLIREVGIKVGEGSFSISQEHALSAILKFHMGHILFRGSQSKSTKNCRVVICTPEGDYHEFGILNAALLCNHYNLPFFYLGPNLPSESLLDAYRSLEGNLIILGSTLTPENRAANFLNNYLEAVHTGIGSGHLLVGGGPHVDRSRLEKSKNVDFLSSMEELDNYLKGL